MKDTNSGSSSTPENVHVEPPVENHNPSNRPPQDIRNAKWLTISNDEDIMWWGHPSLIPHFPSIAGGFIAILIGLGGAIFGFGETIELGLLPLVMVPVGLGVIGFEYLKKVTTFYVVTDDKVVKKTGILSRERIEVRYENIEHCRASQSIIERLFDFGDIIISTAGTSAEESHLIDVNDPTLVSSLINQNKDNAYNALRRQSDDSSEGE